MFPKTDIEPKNEFFNFIRQFSTIYKQFENAKEIRDWVSMDKIQYSASSSIGYRYCLLSHAMGFIDPLYSRGLSNTLEIINLVGKLLINAVQNDNFHIDQFKIIDTIQQGLVTWNDRLVNASYIAFRNYALWNAWFRVWGLIQPLGMFRIDNVYRQFKLTGDRNYFDRLDNPQIPGGLTPDHEDYMHFLEQALQIYESFLSL